jgi:hypothetical protein
MSVKLDHIVFGCTELDAGAAWLSERLGVAETARGVHAMMGTHNALWNMGDAYIELVAINPDSPHPGRPRWFGLDDAATQAKLSNGVSLLTWAIAGAPIEPVIAKVPVALGPVESFARDDLAWNVAVPVAGTPGLGGAFPLTLEWTAGLHPAARLPDVGIRCERLVVRHPESGEIQNALGPVGAPVKIEEGAFALIASLATPNGTQIFEA